MRQVIARKPFGGPLPLAVAASYTRSHAARAGQRSAGSFGS